MATQNVRRKNPSASRLTLERELELLCGVDPRCPAFDSDDERRAAWAFHRDELLASANYGTRPSAWWWYDHPGGRDLAGTDAVVELIRCGELRDDEAARLRALGGNYWPAAVARAWSEREAGNG